MDNILNVVHAEDIPDDDEDIEILEHIEIVIDEDLMPFLQGLIEEDEPSDIDDRILEEEPVDISTPILDTEVRFSTPSLIKLIKRSGVIDEDGIPKGIMNNAVDYITNIAYTKLNDILTHSLTILDERGAKILTKNDVVQSLKLNGENIII
jgi:histone H3/H4